MGMLLRRHESYMAKKAEEPEQEAAQAVSEAPRPTLDGMSRQELAAMAESMGIKVAARWNKSDIAKAIEEA